MEAIGAVKCITALYATKKARCKYLVGHDDSSTRANIKHSFQAKITAEIWSDKETCWPKKNGKYLKDYGKLLLDVPEIEGYLQTLLTAPSALGRTYSNLPRKKENSYHLIR